MSTKDMRRRRGRRDRSPIWTRPQPGARQPKLTRDQIAALALAIADAEGFEAVSMRRLATDLDVGTMTLYYYVRTKDDLLALMDDTLMGEVLVPPAEMPRGWRAGLTAIAHRNHATFLRHPWAMRGLEGARMGGPNGMRHVEQSLGAVADLALPLAERIGVIAIVDDYVFGHILRASDPGMAGADAPTISAIVKFTRTQLATGEYPQLVTLIGDDDPAIAFAKFGRWMSSEARFQLGLEALLDGIAQRVKKKR
ncbi:MAG: TetR/AcrR family transcriptional regulator C-terminal domain-containing protein [Kofleriaceae bacterium]